MTATHAKRLQYFHTHYLDKIIQLYHPTSVWLWGSSAYGQPHAESDIDLIVVSEAFNNIKFSRRMALLLRRIGVSQDRNVGAIDVLCYTPKEFSRKRQQITILNRAVREGIRLV
ncbi:MAG: nucleotidyltransferase [Chloroflexi bacterium]|nr:nucleotidyltransferase [Chloroflexota bacterium]